MAIGDMSQVMNMVVNKLCSNIKYWHKSDDILEQTLEAFVELTVTSYSSSKTLLSLETVNFLVHNHVGAHFPFLGYDNDNKYRVTFYSALSRLVFSSSVDLNNSFDTFIAPNLEIIAQLSQTADIRTPAVKIALLGALRDLRGITESTYNKRTYNLLFDALYPDAFPLLVRVAEKWYDDATVMTALLKFIKVFGFSHSCSSSRFIIHHSSFIIHHPSIYCNLQSRNEMLILFSLFSLPISSI
jgi:exportin-7